VAVSRLDGRHRAVLTTGLLRPQLVHSRRDRCRIGLLATTALLLGGDTVELDVTVGPGARLELFDVAGTVAFNGRGSAADWHVRVRLAPDARLLLSGLPFVVADGAHVTRSLELDASASASALLRDTVVLGRCGERGGWLTNNASVSMAGRLVLREDQELDPSWRQLPGLLGGARVLDTITALGASSWPTSHEARDVSVFRLPDGAGVLCRYLGQELATSPLHEEWARLTQVWPLLPRSGPAEYS